MIEQDRRLKQVNTAFNQEVGGLQDQIECRGEDFKYVDNLTQEQHPMRYRAEFVDRSYNQLVQNEELPRIGRWDSYDHLKMVPLMKRKLKQGCRLWDLSPLL